MDEERDYSMSLSGRIGLLFIAVGFVIFLYSFYHIPSMISPVGGNYVNLGFSIGIGFISIGIALISIGISKESKEIAEDSDKKMQSIATADFYEITYRFWDRAPILYNNQIKEVRDTKSWQLGNLFRHGEKLKKWADSDVQGRLIKEFKTFLERLRPTTSKKYWVEIKNYIGICKIAIDFKTENDNIKDELINELENWIGKKERGESNEDYLKRKSNEFLQKKKYDIFSISTRGSF